ncbi:hypothetical protein [Streptomyces sp. NRRL F-2580]|uniref:hypothetical protein n=1 Tax=Streptomyces sp. NRRL F-2580 TaxID=1463841 RepID=UPI0004C7C18A|nr:hypothetical protein [Streptomyces sp. NRRL F-2580]
MSAQPLRARAQAAVEAELGRQGVRTTVMAENGMRLDAGGHDSRGPVAIAVSLAVPAVLSPAALVLLAAG